MAEKLQGPMTVAQPLLGAIGLNASAAIHTRRLGYRGWTGAINTDYDPVDPRTAAQPFDAYRMLHASGRLHYSPRRATWILHRNGDVRDALRSTDAVTSTQGVTRMRIAAPVLVLSDDEEHSRLRKQVQPAFTRGALSSWQEKVDELAAEMVGDVLADPGSDVVQRLTIPMPIRLIASILGIPDDDVAKFRRWSEKGVAITEFSPSPRGMRDSLESLASILSLRRYFYKQFAAGALKGSDSVLGRLLAHNDDGELTEGQLFLITMLLLFAGNETTTNLLGGMFDTLAANPEQFQMIRADPDLIPMAVEEQLRYSSPIQNLYRYTRDDYQVGDVTIPSGSRLLLSFGAANRDPELFENPDEYRAERNPRMHIAFGYGAHMCIGAPLARMEAQAVLRELVTRVSAIEALGPTTWSTHSSLRGPTRLPIRLTPA